MANNHTSFTKVPCNNIEEQVKNNINSPLIDLRHSNKLMNSGLKFDSIPPSSSFVGHARIMASKGMVSENDEHLKFNCKYCERKFANMQALGGDQNAHRVLRFIEKNNKNGMIEMGRYLTSDLPRSPDCPLIHPRALNRAMVNCPYYVTFTQKALHGYARVSGAFEPLYNNISIDPMARPMMTNSPLSPPIIRGNQIANGSYFSIDENASFNSERIPTAPLNLLSNVVPKHLFHNTSEIGDNVGSNVVETGDTIESNDLEKLHQDSELDLALKLGY